MSSRAPVSFNVLIVGAGIAGLGAAVCLARKGHRVTVIEATDRLNEVGAGIQIPPNSSRIVESYGLREKFIQKVVWPEKIILRRWETGSIIGLTPLHPNMMEQYRFPYWLIHRPDYQRLLYDGAKAAGANIILGAKLEYIDESIPAAILKDGTVLKADLVVGADGIRSTVRRAVIPEKEITALDYPISVFRATVPATVMKSDPQIAHLMTDINANVWIGHERHIMAYPIQNGRQYNLVLAHPGEAAVGKWKEPGDVREMRSYYRNFDPTIQRVLYHIDGCLKWKIAELPSLRTWVSESGRVVLIGDAAHAMVQNLAQGAATSIEDGASLGECLDRARSVADIPRVLHAFQAIRKPRCETIQEASRKHGDFINLADGPEQRQRDENLKQDLLRESGKHLQQPLQQPRTSPNKWSDSVFQMWLFGHDAIKHARMELDRLLDARDSSHSGLL